MRPDYNASTMMLAGQVLKPSDSQSDRLGYKARKRRHVLLSQGRALAKFLEVAFQATATSLVVVARINAGRWT